VDDRFKRGQVFAGKLDENSHASFSSRKRRTIRDEIVLALPSMCAQQFEDAPFLLWDNPSAFLSSCLQSVVSVWIRDSTRIAKALPDDYSFERLRFFMKPGHRED